MNENERTIELDIPILLPEIADARDECVQRLQEILGNRRGIIDSHLKLTEKEAGQPAQLCIHFDPDLISLAAVRRMARETGAEFSERYRHEQIPFHGLDAADIAEDLTDALEELQGMVHANANYAAGVAYVAYDSEALSRPTIERTLRRFGAQTVSPRAPAEPEAEPRHAGLPSFLPRWIRRRWTLLLVALAGLSLLGGWAGTRFFGLPQDTALAFFLLAYFFGGYDVAIHAIPGFFRGRFNTDVLMLAAALGAALIGQWAEGAFLLFLFSLAHAGEHLALSRARNAINSLGQLMPNMAQVRRGEQVVEEAVGDLEIGDVVVVRPGDRVAVDGVIVSGKSTLDESAITGESVPVAKDEEDEVFAGTINREAAIDVRVTRLAEDNTLSRVMQMVAEAQSQQSPTQQLTERFTRWFVPAVLVSVVLVTLVPPLLGWLSLRDSFYRAMLLLVAASPCALALGTPAAVLTGIAQAARNGVLVKGGVHMENLGALDVLAFDKTGTLTRGEFRVTDVIALDSGREDDLLSLTAAVEQQSNHPLALAVVQAARERNLTLPQAQGLENLTGRGVRSSVGGQEVLIGTLEAFHEANGDMPYEEVRQTVTQLEEQGKTTMVVSRSGKPLGILALADVPREGVREVLQTLRQMGIKELVMLTGDNEKVAREVGTEVGVTDVRAGLLPEEKLEAIRALQEEYGAVAMTGDGVNDAPALATATVGIAMGGAGTAVALETADVALMADDLSKLPFAVGLSRAGRAVIRQNLVLSLAVIALLIVTSVTGLVALSGAVLLHEGSTLAVVLNALRLLRFKMWTAADHF